MKTKVRYVKPQVCVIGLGQVGLPTYNYIKETLGKKWIVKGFDIDKEKVEKITNINHDKNIISDWKKIVSDISNVYVICVSTGFNKVDPLKPDLSSIYKVCVNIKNSLDSYLDSPEDSTEYPLVSIESTIVPNTCKKIFKNIFNGKVHLVHCSHRFYDAEPIIHGVNQARVFGAINENSYKKGMYFYKEQLRIPIIPLSKIEEAEMCKIAENSFRHIQIAFAEQLRMLCEENNINFSNVKFGCNTKWNINIPEALNGIGKACLPKDIKYLASLGESQFLFDAMKLDKKYRDWLEQLRK